MFDEVYKEIKLEDTPVKDEREFDKIDKIMKEKSDVDERKCKGRD